MSRNERREKRRMCRRARLALHETKRRRLLDDDVDLRSSRLAIVLEVRLPAAVEERLQDFGHHPTLEECAAKRMAA
jgi:hypothetical protein